VDWRKGWKTLEEQKRDESNNGIGDLNLTSLSEMGYGFHLMQEVGL
jgi:hypothetical protein